jgi:hypothetical protein
MRRWWIAVLAAGTVGVVVLLTGSQAWTVVRVGAPRLSKSLSSTVPGTRAA